MKKFILMSSFLLFSFAARGEFVRTEKKPDFFIPEKEISKPSYFVKETKRFERASSDTVAHISSRNGAEQANDAPVSFSPAAYKNRPKINNNKKQNAPEDEGLEIPHFQKKYDEYHEDILKMKKTGRLPTNKTLENDLKKMSGEKRFEVSD